MAADYDRLFQGPDGAVAPGGAGTNGDDDPFSDLFGDLDSSQDETLDRELNSPFPAPPMPTGMPKPNGQATSPMPIDGIEEPQLPALPETPPMPVDRAARPASPESRQPPMPVDYDRLFEPDGGAITPDEPGAPADYDLDDFAAPTMPPAPPGPTMPIGPRGPTGVPEPNGQVPPPMPVHWAEQPSSATPRKNPPMPVGPLTGAEPPAPTAPETPAQAAGQDARHGRHSRRGSGDAPDPQPGPQAKSPNSHRAGGHQEVENAAGRPAPLRPFAGSPEGRPAEMQGRRVRGDMRPAGSAQPAVEPAGDRPAEATAPLRAAPVQGAAAHSVPSRRAADRRKKPVKARAGRGTSTEQLPAARMVPRRGWRRRVHALTRINFGLSRDEKYELELENRIRRTVRGSYLIGVLGLKGGSGKTSMTAALGSAFAQVRGDRILAVDADPVCGNLADRVGRQRAATIADLLANRALSHYNDVRAHTSMNAVNLELLAAADYNATRSRLSEEDWKLTLGTVPRYYNLVLADCGADLFGPAARGVLAAASGLIITSSAAPDSVRQVAVAADWLGNNGYRALLSRACVVINHVVRDGSVKAESDAARQFQTNVQPGRMIVLPWDEHIATGSAVQFAQLSPAYRRKIIELAAALSDDFDRGERR